MKGRGVRVWRDSNGELCHTVRGRALVFPVLIVVLGLGAWAVLAIYGLIRLGVIR